VTAPVSKKAFEEDLKPSINSKPVLPNPSSEIRSLHTSRIQSRIYNRRISTETMGRTKKSEDSQTRELKEVATGTVNLEDLQNPPVETLNNTANTKGLRGDKPNSTLRNSEMEEYNNMPMTDTKKRVVKLQPQQQSASSKGFDVIEVSHQNL
jgi:hypothetical protein